MKLISFCMFVFGCFVMYLGIVGVGGTILIIPTILGGVIAISSFLWLIFA
jgi:hypothetical protein